MKNVFLLLTACVLCFTTVTAQQWEKYKAEDLQFVAYYPQTPRRTVQKVPIPSGELDMHLVMYSPKLGDDNAIYSVVRSDYPKSQFENADKEYNDKILANVVNVAVSNVQGRLIFENKIEFNGYPGRSIKVQAQGKFFYLNAYLVENTIFITQVVCMAEKDKNASIQRFLDSFEIIKTK
ncbi:MAG: hypothetical protein AAF611_16745 [Bacteroidota bacterium]